MKIRVEKTEFNERAAQNYGPGHQDKMELMFLVNMLVNHGLDAGTPQKFTCKGNEKCGRTIHTKDRQLTVDLYVTGTMEYPTIQGQAYPGVFRFEFYAMRHGGIFLEWMDEDEEAEQAVDAMIFEEESQLSLF